MKRLVFCFDGTWNRLDAPFPTNVVLTAESVLPWPDDGSAQVVYYDEGVGTGEDDKLSGGLFGAGLFKNLLDAYRFLIFNHTPGDEIYIFGFSRGAYTARSFAGLIACCSILPRSLAGDANHALELYRSRDSSDAYKEKMRRYRLQNAPHLCIGSDLEWRQQTVRDYDAATATELAVRYLGVWDTVGALGIPSWVIFSGAVDEQFRFHDTSLSSFVVHARHAVAIDERRLDFAPTLWDNLGDLNKARGAENGAADAPYQQVWFPGVHGSVGGGGDVRGLSDQALDWIWDGARHAGLRLDTARGSRVYSLSPDDTAPLDNVSKKNDGPSIVGVIMDHMIKADRMPGPAALSEVSVSARRRWKQSADRLPERHVYRPHTLDKVAAQINGIDPAELGLNGDGSEATPDPFTLYEVTQGDSLSKIAKNLLGDANKWPLIYEYNRYKLVDPNHIYLGQVVRVPTFI